jgi:hypothetical protein
MKRSRHVPDPGSRQQVEAMAGFGMPEAGIARLIGIDAPTLQKRYADEIEGGVMKANTRVAENLYRKATGDGREAVIAAIFWLKTRAGGRRLRRTSLPGTAGSRSR